MGGVNTFDSAIDGFKFEKFQVSGFAKSLARSLVLSIFIMVLSKKLIIESAGLGFQIPGFYQPIG